MTQPTIEECIEWLDAFIAAPNTALYPTGHAVIIRAALAEKQVVPETTSSKSDAQIADELQQSMDALLEPDDEGDKIKYRTLIRIMARARNRLRQIDVALAAQREGK